MEEEEVALAQPGRAAALIGVVALAVALPLLPIVLGLGLAPAPAQDLVAAGLGSLVAFVGGVKFAAAAWGLIVRFRAGSGAQFAAASID